MRGRSTHPTGREKECVGATGPSFYKERLGTGSPPHPSPSVTASPQGEASGLCYPTRKKRPKSGHVHGHRNSPSTGTLRLPTPKPASGNERAIKTGGPGGLPPALFLPISREKWGPPPGRRAPRGAAPRGTGKAPTTRRVRSTLPHPRPGPGGEPRRRSGPAMVQDWTTCRQQRPAKGPPHAPEAQPVPSTGPW